MLGRKAKITESIYKTDFSVLMKQELSPRIKLRLLGLRNVSKGMNFRQVSNVLGVHEKSVKNWVRGFGKDGINGLRDKPGRGRKPKLPLSKNDYFVKSVIKLQEDLKGGRVNAKNINEMLMKEFDVNCSISSTYRLLKRAGLSWVSARSKHPNSNVEQQMSFKKTLKMKLQKCCQNQ